MTVFLALAIVAAALVLILRGTDARVVLFAAALVIGAIAGQPGVVFKKAAEALCDPKFLLPICSAMGFAHVVRETGCVEALVRLLVRPILRVSRLAAPGSAFVTFVVNVAIPSQTSTLAASGPLMVALLGTLGTSAAAAGAALVYGASIGGGLLNPGLGEIIVVAESAAISAPALSLLLVPAVLVTFAFGLAALLLVARRRDPSDAPLPGAPDPDGGETRPDPSRYKALLPPLPVVWLLLTHPALPTRAWLGRVTPQGHDVFVAMLAGSTLTIALASRDRTKTTRALFDGMGYAFAHVITVIAVSAATAKALEVAGVLQAFVALVSGSPTAALAAAFFLAFALAALSGSGTASSVALVGALGPHVGELGVALLPLGGVILLGAEAGRTTSPVAAVLLFGSTLVSVPPRTLAQRLVVPCLAAAAMGAVVFAASHR